MVVIVFLVVFLKDLGILMNIIIVLLKYFDYWFFVVLIFLELLDYNDMGFW